MTDTFGDVAQSMQSTWAMAFALGDWRAIAALYAPETAFYGSTPALATDPAGVLSYFETLPFDFVGARYATPHILPMGEGLFAASGGVVFKLRIAGVEHERAYRMSQVFRRLPEGWRIVLHHASPVPESALSA